VRAELCGEQNTVRPACKRPKPTAKGVTDRFVDGGSQRFGFNRNMVPTTIGVVGCSGGSRGSRTLISFGTYARFPGSLEDPGKIHVQLSKCMTAVSCTLAPCLRSITSSLVYDAYCKYNVILVTRQQWVLRVRLLLPVG
jgi:hypothetical protein